MTETQFKKFEKGTCSADEINEQLKYFKENPSEVDNHFTNEEWEEFYLNNKERLPKEKSEKFFQNIESLIKEDKKKRVNISLVASLVAASLLIFISILFWNQETLPKSNQFAINKNVLIKHANFGKENISFILPDGTKVTLFPQSEIQFDSVFKNKRIVYLNGKAKFDVVHDDSRVFKVECKDIVTTDIGTSFLIDGQQNNVRIDLYEGKVSVAKLKDKNSTVFLNPGQYALYDSKTKSLAIGNNTVKLAINNTANTSVDDASIVGFKNNSLKKVLDQLSLLYKVKIEYPTAKVSHIQMSMAIDSSQKIETILKNIAIIGDLKLIKNGDKNYVLK